MDHDSPTTLRGVGLNFARGLLMGVFDIVPGISGGTVALIVGIYARLVASIRYAAAAPVSLLRGDLAGMRMRLRQVEWGLVLPLGVGIVTALVVGALVVEQLIETYPAASRALFFGLIAASVPLPWRRMSQRDGRALGIAVVFGTFAFLVTAVPPLTVEDPALILVFLAASVAICAMILPGLSGAFLLLIFGMYTPTLAAVSERDFIYIAVFGAGAVLGLGLFSQLLEWLLETRRNATMAALVGLMVGSLRVLWPWQTEDRDFLAPPDLGSTLVVVLLAAIGFAIVTALVRLAAQKAPEASTDRVEPPAG